jgi:hypothetical protein
MTKPLTRATFEKLCMLMGVRQNPGINWRRIVSLKEGNVTWEDLVFSFLCFLLAIIPEYQGIDLVFGHNPCYLLLLLFLLFDTFCMAI